MALTRKILADLGVPAEHINAIMAARDDILEGYHTKAQLDTAVADAVKKAATDSPTDITKHPDYIKLQADLAAEQTGRKTDKRDAAIHAALTEAKTKNPKAAIALMDVSKFELQDDGTVKGLKEAMEALQKSDAYLFGNVQQPAQQQTYTPGFNPPPGGAPNGLQQQIDAAREAGNMPLVASLIRQQAEAAQTKT